MHRACQRTSKAPPYERTLVEIVTRMNPFLDDFSSPLTPWKGIVLLMLSPLIIVRLSLGFTVVALYTCFLMVRFGRNNGRLPWPCVNNITVAVECPSARRCGAESLFFCSQF